MFTVTLQIFDGNMNAGKFIIMCCEYATFHQALRNKECFDAVDLFLSQMKTYSNFYK